MSGKQVKAFEPVSAEDYPFTGTTQVFRFQGYAREVNSAHDLQVRQPEFPNDPPFVLLTDIQNCFALPETENVFDSLHFRRGDVSLAFARDSNLQPYVPARIPCNTIVDGPSEVIDIFLIDPTSSAGGGAGGLESEDDEAFRFSAS